MALDLANLVRIGSAPFAASDVKSAYLYTTPDTVATVLAAGYFNGATNKLKKGDQIFAACVLNGTPTCTHLIVTSASGAAVVTTAAAIFA